MKKMIYTIIIAGIVITAFNLYATKKVFDSQIYDSRQKIGQTIFIWFVPLLGAALAIHVIKGSNPILRSDKDMEVSDLLVPREHRENDDHLEFWHE